MRAGSLRRSETRVIRPFASSDFLKETELSLNSESCPFESDELIDYSKVEEIGESLAPVLRIPALPSDLPELVECSLDELAFVIWASDPSLKVHQASHVLKVADWPSAPIALHKDFVGRISWSPNCMLGVSLVLRQSRPTTRLGVASRAGQWLSQKVFRISAEDVGTELPIAYVDDVVFEDKGYPRETVYVLEFDDGASLNEPLEVGQDFPFRIWFSEKVASRMKNSNTSAAKALSAQFNAYVVIEILRYGISRLEDENSIVPNSPLDRFLRLTKSHTGLLEEEILGQFRGESVEKVRCLLEAKLGLRTVLVDSLI